jgi:hypothetical protein
MVGSFVLRDPERGYNKRFLRNRADPVSGEYAFADEVQRTPDVDIAYSRITIF